MKIGRTLLILLKKLDPDEELRIIITVSEAIELSQITSELKSKGVTDVTQGDTYTFFAKGTQKAIIAITEFEWVTLVLEDHAGVSLIE